MNIFWLIKEWLILIMDVIEEVKNLICENGPHEHVWVQSPKDQLKCPLIKTWEISDVLETQN